jgi:hypothetical protein
MIFRVGFGLMRLASGFFPEVGTTFGVAPDLADSVLTVVAGTPPQLPHPINHSFQALQIHVHVAD